MLGNDEKKVEYIELIYDLIFVYLIGKNAALLSSVEAGFIRWSAISGMLKVSTPKA